MSTTHTTPTATNTTSHRTPTLGPDGATTHRAPVGAPPLPMSYVYVPESCPVLDLEFDNMGGVDDDMVSAAYATTVYGSK